ncbi:MFS transporter [Phenylobacterium sp.]|jgi:MFS family permease|uniref:MFS transporter n=1 Tax=Phenylobacterium sp. TaxID=1871053 RepID=UPI002E380388|nr:MFS transporter [Phenylobacterium sp.]HEX3365303.1 MFS transporter [Phenylobacterium sp.]
MSIVLVPSAGNGLRLEARATSRGWLVLCVSFALLLSDHMSRQVLSAAFPLLKVDWGLSDTRLGALSGVVALMVGILTVPLSLVADRVGRARSVAVMALTWSLATLACAACASYGQLLAARFVLGVGEAAYGSVGLAVVFTYFPKSLRATITGVFMAGGVFGSFIGLALGGAMAAHLGWRGAFAGMAVFGLALAAAYAVFVRDGPAPLPNAEAGGVAPHGLNGIARGLFGSPGVVLTYVASGLQLFVLGSLTAWAPSYLNRFQSLSLQAAAASAATLLFAAGIGMVVCGGFADRFCAGRPHRRPALAAAYGVVTFVFLEAAFHLPPGPPQVVCALLGLFCAGGTTGPAGAMVAERTPAALHGAALAVLTLSNNLIGLAPGPLVTGFLADRFGLPTAIQLTPVAALIAAAVFWITGSTQRSTKKSTA